MKEREERKKKEEAEKAASSQNVIPTFTATSGKLKVNPMYARERLNSMNPMMLPRGRQNSVTKGLTGA